MIVKNNYDECPTNLACSIRRYFGLEFHHKTLPFIDEILDRKKPENVVVIVLDGMGTNIMNRALGTESFFRQNLKKSITSVFPATTTAATNSLMTGLNPVEHGWLGWTMYIEPIDKIITLFRNSQKGHDDETCEEFLAMKSKLVTKTIVDELNENNQHSGRALLSFGDKPYADLDDMLGRIESEAKKPGKKYIYAYNSQPDSTMHSLGSDCHEAKDLIRERDRKICELCGKLKNTLMIVTADHGHRNAENIFLRNYPELLELMDRSTSLEQRAASFAIKTGRQDDFRKLFEKLLGTDFKLYSKKDVVESKLFGDGTQNELFDLALGDFIAIAEDSDKCLLDVGDAELKSNHAGYSDDEIIVPVIVKMCG